MALRLIIADDDALGRALIEAIVELAKRHQPDAAVLRAIREAAADSAG